MSEWTKGPWTAVRYSNKFFGLGQNMQESHFMLQCRWGNTTDAHNVANAHLIASAPEMYEALKEAQAMIEGEYHPDHPTNRIIRAALAKAEGRHA